MDTTLSTHYLARIEELSLLVEPASEEASSLAELHDRIAEGFRDDLADQLDILAAAIEHRGLAQAYLLDTDTGREIREAAMGRLRGTETTLRAMATRLEATTEQGQRAAIAESMRRLLSDHRAAFRHALDLVGPDLVDVAGPGALLASIEDISAIDRPEHEPAETSPTPTSRKIEFPSLETRDYPDPMTERLLASDANPRIEERGWADPAAATLARSRVGRALEQRPSAETREALTDIDASLRRAARNYGAAYAVAAGLAALPSPVEAGARLIAMAEARATLLRQRIDASSALGRGARRTLEAQHAQRVGEAEALRIAIDRHGDPSQVQIQQVAEGLRADAKALDAESANLDPRAYRGLRSALEGAVNATEGVGEAGAPESFEAELAGAAAALDSETSRARARSSRVDVPTETEHGAMSEGRDRLATIATDRILGRRSPRFYDSQLPSFTATRILVDEDPDIESLDVRGETDRFAFARGAGLSATPTSQRSAIGIDGGADIATNVQQRTSAAQQPTKTPHLAQFGREVARSLTSLSAVFEAGMRSSRSLGPAAAAGPAPVSMAMAASMPSNIFADTSSPLVQNVYMPALARLAGVPTVRRPAARMSPTMASVVKEFAAPEALFGALLGKAGERLREEEPEAADRLEARLKQVARMLPKAGSFSPDILSKYAGKMRARVESWLGGGSTKGIEHGADQDSLTPEGGAVRAVGEYIGGLFSPEMEGTGESYSNLADKEAERVESKLRSERKPIDLPAIKGLEDFLGEGMSSVRAFEGPTATEIARTIGAEAFTVKNLMFFQKGKLDPTSPKGRGLIAHELVHAKEPHLAKTQAQIAKEERQAYGVQAMVEQHTAEDLDRQMNRTYADMSLAKELNIPKIRLPDELGGTADTVEADPGLRTADPKDQAHKEEQILEALTDAVADLIDQHGINETDRYGRRG